MQKNAEIFKNLYILFFYFKEKRYICSENKNNV